MDESDPFATKPPGAVPPRALPSELPQHIEPYQVEKILGEGGFGRVYLARDEVLGRLIAIKVPQADRVRKPEDVEDYLAEGRVLAALDYPHIMPVHDAGSTNDGLCYVVSKLIEGSDLAARIAESRSPSPNRRAWSQRWPTPSTTPTSAGWFTETSSRPTCCSIGLANFTSPTQMQIILI